MSFVIVSLIVPLFVFLASCHSGYFYPMKNLEIIEKYSTEYKVDDYLVASIINVESHFNSEVISSKGAIGLMQLLPSTAEWVAGKLKIQFVAQDLLDPEINIKIGSYYLAYLIDYFGDVELAICAYNAGQGNVKKWLSNKDFSLDGVSLKEIPFSETKNYLKKVKQNIEIYKNKFN